MPTIRSAVRDARAAVTRRWSAFGVAVLLTGGLTAAVAGLSASPAAAVTEKSVGTFTVAALANYPDSSTPLSLRTAESGNFAPDDLTLRIPSSRQRTLPNDATYQWLGTPGSTGWVTANFNTESDGISLNPEFGVSAQDVDPQDAVQTLSIDSVQGPGAFAWYQVGTDGGTSSSPPVAGGLRLGNGSEADGSAQSATQDLSDAVVGSGSPGDMVARFSAAGLYCIMLSYSAHVSTAAARQSVTDTVRVAVGDTVPADAACGTPGDGGSTTTPGGGTTPPGGGTTTPPPTDPNAGTGPTGNAIWTDGHVDVIHPTIENDASGKPKLQLRTHDSKTRAENDVIYYSSDVIKQTLPGSFSKDADYSFIGSPGQPVWNSPQDQIAGAPWAGLSTQDDSLRPLAGKPFSVRLDAVTGPHGQPAPGDAAIWVTGAQQGFASNVYASTKTGLPAAWRIGFNTHAHFNWSFTQAGVYCLAFSVEAPMPDGTRQTASEQITMAIGSSVDPTTVTPCGRTQSYPSPGAKPVVSDPGPAPVLVEDEAANFAPRLAGDQLSVGLRRSDPYLARPGTTADIDDVIVHQPFGASLPYQIQQVTMRDDSTQLGWDTTGVASSAVSGDITWSLDRVRGPGGVSMTELSDSQDPLLDTATGNSSRTLWPDSGVHYTQWDVARPGKYCIDMTWSATLSSGEPVSDHHVLTLVVDGPLDPKNWQFNQQSTQPKLVATGPTFTHDADTLTKTCAAGGQPTSPDQVPVDGSGSSTPPGSGTTPPTGPVSSGRDVLKIGHMDVMSTVTGQQLAVTVHDDNTSPATVHDPAKLIFYAAPGSETHIPTDTKYSFIGKAGAPVWILPQTQDPSLLWPGWNVDLAGNQAATGVQWTLDSVKGPGDFALFEDVGFGDLSVLLDSNDAAHSSFHYAEHAHGNWAFSADGVYCLNSTFTALPNSVGAAQKQTLLVAVGDLDPQVVTPDDCGKNAAQVRAEGGSQPPSSGSSSPSDGATPTSGSPTPPPGVTAPTESALTPALSGLIRVPSEARAGDRITIGLPSDLVHKQVEVWAFSSPEFVGAPTADASGQVAVTLPADLAAGTHRIAVADAHGHVYGWNPIQILAADQPADYAQGNGSPVAPGTAAGDDAQRQAAGSSSALASTGVRVAGLSLLGLSVLAGGLVLVVSGRRRRGAHR